MGVYWTRGVTDLSSGGDRRAVTEALAGNDPTVQTGEIDGDVTFSGMSNGLDAVEASLCSVEHDLVRAAVVCNWDGGTRPIDGRYYEYRDGGLQVVERVEHDFKWRAGTYFDYFASQYDSLGTI